MTNSYSSKLVGSLIWRMPHAIPEVLTW